MAKIYRCPPEHKHGQNHTCYNAHKCRCSKCRAFATAAAGHRRKLRAYGQWTPYWVPAIGTKRRLQALISIGWSQSKLASHLNVTQAAVWTLLFTDSDQVQHTTHDRVTALYEQLQDQEPTHDTWRTLIAYNRSRNYAATRGWLTPNEWDDIDTDDDPLSLDPDPTYIDVIAVELATTGHRIHLTQHEREAALTYLHSLNRTDGQIADTLGLNIRSVLRIRERLHLTATHSANGNIIIHRDEATAA